MTVRTDAGMISFFICAVSDRNPSSAGQSRAYGARSMRLRSRDAAKLEWRRRASLQGRCDVLPRKSRATRCRAIRSRASPAAARVPATGHATAPAPSRVMNPRRLTSRRLRDTPIGARWSATQATLYLKEQLARLPHQFSSVRTFRNAGASVGHRVLVARYVATDDNVVGVSDSLLSSAWWRCVQEEQKQDRNRSAQRSGLDATIRAVWAAPAHGGRRRRRL